MIFNWSDIEEYWHKKNKQITEALNRFVGVFK